MINRWQEIWNHRETKDITELSLEKLIALDRWDGGAGFVDIRDWQTNARLLSARIGITDHQSVFEVGCGSGAFLYALSEIHTLRIGGADYSKALIEIARRVLPSGQFQWTEAKFIDTEPKYDHVVSQGMFAYFGLDYAQMVLEKMLEKAEKTVCIFELQDKATKSELERIRREWLGEEEYERKYAGLEHTYYDPAWFLKWAGDHGVAGIDVIPSLIPNYAQKKFRFGCIIRV